MKTMLVSACLLGVCCKYSGGSNRCSRVLELAKRVRLVPVCPEQLGGLPTPRVPAECRGACVVNRDGQDVTEAYERGAQAALELAQLLGCTGAILKSRSPSCGVGEIYDGSFSGRTVPGNGVTARKLLEHGIPVFRENEIPDL